MVAALVIVAMVSQTCRWPSARKARRGRGGPGGGMFGPPTAGRSAAATKEVQEALKLTDEQKDKIEEDQRRDARRNARRRSEDGGRSREDDGDR